MRKLTIQCFRRATYHSHVFNMVCTDACKSNRISLSPRPASNCWLFLLEISLIDVPLDSKYVSGSLDVPCKMAPLNSCILQYLSCNQFKLVQRSFFFQTWKHCIEKHLNANFVRFALICKHHLHKVKWENQKRNKGNKL